jgi:biopolymer transport protein ExbD
VKFRRQPRQAVEINLIPFLDVLIFLLVYFMVSTTFTRESHLSIDLPEAQGQAKETVEAGIEILVDETGNYRVNGDALVDNSMQTLEAAIYKISAGDTTMPMTITADADAAHKHVVQAMDAAGQMGFAHLSIATRQPASQTAPPGSKQAP